VLAGNHRSSPYRTSQADYPRFPPWRSPSTHRSYLHRCIFSGSPEITAKANIQRLSPVPMPTFRIRLKFPRGIIKLATP
jgi:hypothetical protein